MEILQNSVKMDSNKSVIDIDGDDDEIMIMEEIPCKKPKLSAQPPPPTTPPTHDTNSDIKKCDILSKTKPVQFTPKLQKKLPRSTFSLSEKVKLQNELKQAQSKISQHKELVLDLRTKLKYQNEGMEKLKKIAKDERKLVRSSQREKLNLKSVLKFERHRSEEKVNRLLDFLRHLNSEFQFALNVLTIENNNTSNSKLAEVALNNNNDDEKSDEVVKPKDMDNELKILSFEIVNKLEKVIDLHIERKDELDSTRKSLEELQAKNKNICTTTSTPTQTVSLANANFEKNNNSSETHHQEPTKLRLKRAKYDYSQQNDEDDLSEIPQLEKYSLSDRPHILQNANTENIENKETSCDGSKDSQSITQIDTNYYDSGRKHVMDTTKRGLSWIYCTCGLKFKLRSGLDSHIKLFRPVNYEDYVIDDDELEEENNGDDVCSKKQKPKLTQTWLIVDNRKTNERYTI